MIAELDTNQKTQARYKTPTTNTNNNKHSFQHPHIISEILRYFIVYESDLIDGYVIYYFLHCDECEQVRQKALVAFK